MGWSVLGVDKMAHLRAYYWNKGDMLELARYQKKELPLVAGGEETILSASEILLSECPPEDDIWFREQLGKYADVMRSSVNVQTKKQAWFRSQIWDL
jgi:hypothetical protein